MPYPRKQAVAIFLDKQKRQGLAAAKAFASKHSGTPAYKGRKVIARTADLGDVNSRSDSAQNDGATTRRPKQRRAYRGYTLSEGNNQRNKRS